ncbi:hypothetical protein [Agromyces sp. Soil535]|uniref:sugar ABC transporter substrate-binding protein n=1 Tax=Agromyces sp. Soil535 TaxID=1736390 RepID=UPI0006F9056D|nr:hypothetical protein [Agromyces sp. Soil535]KRE23304.1 hypothetical protein ASG80_06130 [Agromyces sp. Soil535]
MNTASPLGRRRARAFAAASAIAIAALTLAGCAANGGSAPESSPSTSPAAESDLAATVAKLQEPLEAYPVPTEPIEDVSSVEGKTVYYIPITLQSPAFTVTANGLTDALETVGVNVQLCDGKGTPTDISACVNQATEANAASIVLDAIPYGLAGNALDAAQAAGIPVIINNQIPDPAHPDSETLETIPGSGTSMEVALSQWFALDSNGAGSLLINQSTDGPSPAAYVKTAQEEIADDCADCTITINGISVSSFSLIPSSTSAALLQNPEIGYVEAQYDQYLQPTQGGVQQSGRTDIKGMAGAAGLGSLQALENGTFLYAAASPALTFQGWIDADASLRLILGIPVPDYVVPVRLFTRDTISNDTLTEEAEASGEWFGPTTFPKDFESLWGVA